MKGSDPEKIDLIAEHVGAQAQKLDQLVAHVAGIQKTQDAMLGEMISMKRYMYEELATKVELHALEDRVLTRFDQQGVILHRLDHESAAMTGRVARIDDRVETLEGQMKGAS